MAARPRLFFKTLASLSRMRLLHRLLTGGPSTAEGLAAATGLNRNTVREHLHRLIAVGFVGVESLLRGTRGRPRLRYSALALPPAADRPMRSAPDGSGAGSAGAAARGGTSAGRSHAQLAALGDHMVQCGFTAAIHAEDGVMVLRDCPFARLSAEDPGVCEVHRLLIDRALVGAGGPVRAGELHRFSGEHECTLELIGVPQDAAGPAQYTTSGV